ncbi:glycoside hydrolase domain-containing protein [Streptacidiphilus cavernicola]|uniref:Glycoside hydrolase domain-containing protein n=1 Tax=Streptacidiphilus cavernicola TaxID=3342716 RepID=A0ABV6VRF1_9ACTN
MSNRRRPKSARRRYGVISLAVTVALGGGVAVALAATSGSSGDGQRTVSDTAPLGPSGTPAASATGSAKASAGGSPTATGTATGTAGATTTAGAKATASASGSAGAKAGKAASGGTPAKSVPLPGHAPAVFTGRAFDTCTAPTLATMTAWRKSSPYGAAAVYVGGRNRGCAQPQLTNSWVHSVSSAGWKLIPLYVGAQPPCQTGGNPERITAADADSLGATDGADAASRAAALGMRAGSTLYLDMEAYDTSNTACVAAVQSYVQAWDRAAHGKGYWAGFYGFSQSSAAAVASAKSAGRPDLPDAFWYARYDGNADTTTGFPYSSSLWTGHRRGHQYAVNLKETFGGAALTVDHDAWDGPVAIVG